jgi:hypothetical protein
MIMGRGYLRRPRAFDGVSHWTQTFPDIIERMRRPGYTVLVALIALGLAGCGASRGATVAPRSPSPTHTEGASAASRLSDAQDELVQAGIGRYQATVESSGLARPVIVELTDYDLKSEAFSSERVLANPEAGAGDPETFVMNIRMTSDRGMFMRMHDWGTWDGCWLPFRPKDIENVTGFDVSTGPGMPATVAAVLAARASGRQSEEDTIVASVPGLTGLQLLGISPAKLAKLGSGTEIDGVDVPISIGLSDRRIATAAADGSEIYDTLVEADVSLGDQIGPYLRSVTAHVDFSVVAMVEIVVPEPELLLPRNAKPSDTCRGFR